MHFFSLLFVLSSLSVFPIANAWDCVCGSYCPNATLPYLSPVKCPVGYYCPEGGYLKQTFPVVCPAGHQCPKSGLCTPLGCPCGFFCPKGSSAPKPCQAGTYSVANSSQCTACVSSGSCPQSNMCKPTTSSVSKRTTSPASTTPACVCPSELLPGYICPSIPLVTTGCEPFCNNLVICGTTVGPIVGNSTSGIGAELFGVTTPPAYHCGYYVPPPYPQSPKFEQPCQAGFYCPQGATPSTPIMPIQCSAGYYCPVKTCKPIPCSTCPAGSSAPN